MAREAQKTFTIADFFDRASSNHIVAVSVHTINRPRLKTANDICQIKQVFTEFCRKHTWGSIVWMQPTSVCVDMCIDVSTTTLRVMCLQGSHGIRIPTLDTIGADCLDYKIENINQTSVQMGFEPKSPP